MIGGETRLVALLGHPVAHSLSPRMQNAAFAARALDWAYVALDVAPERLADAVRGLAAAGFAGANVTAPHKLAAARLCDEADADSVNTLVFRDGRIVGHEHRRGGAGRAHRSSGPRSSATAAPRARSRRRCRARASSRGAATGRRTCATRTSSCTRPRRATTCSSSCARARRSSTCRTRRARPARAARAAGATVVDGLEVLVRQGAASFELWTGVPAPLDVMRNAVRSAP